MENLSIDLSRPKLTVFPENIINPTLPLTLVSYNVHFGKKTELIQAIFEQNENLSKADIILLQEVEDHVVEIKSRAEKLAASLGYHCVYAPAQIRKQKGTHGLAILSRLPIKTYKVVALPKYKLMFRERSRIALYVDLELAGKVIRVCNIHLDMPLSAEDRITQISPALEALEKTPVDAIIFAGDLNTAPLKWAARGIPVSYSNQRRLVRKHLLDRGYEVASNHRGYTHVSPLGHMNLDGIYTRDVKLIDFGVEQDIDVSDHRPLWVKFEV